MNMSQYWKDRAELAERYIDLCHAEQPDPEEIERTKQRWIDKVEELQSISTVIRKVSP